MSGFAPSKFQFLTGTGAPNAGGSLHVYASGSTTPVTIYSDGGLINPTTNPLTLDSNGVAKFYVSGTEDYRFDSYDSSGGFIETIDPVFFVGDAGTSTTNQITYQSSDFTLATTQGSLNFVATSAITVTLNATTAYTNSFQTTFNAQGGAITFTPNGTDQINGANANFVIPKGYSGVLWTDASGNWGFNFDNIGGLLNVQTFTATGAGTYTPTPGMRTCIIELQGPGGGSGGSTGAASQSAAPGAGGGGAYMKLLATAANIGASASLNVGPGGAAGASGNNAGSAGASNTTITINSSTWTAASGGGGSGQASSASAQFGANGGAAGTNTTGTHATLLVSIPGQAGASGFSNGSTVAIIMAGKGGDAFLGKGGVPNAAAAAAGGNYGGGASGQVNASGSNSGGTAGAQGIIIIYEYA